MIKSVSRTAIVLSALALSSGVSAETLQDALVKAYLNNPTLRAERAALRSTDEGVPQALSNWRPTVEVKGDVGIDRTNSTTTGSNKSADVTQPRSASLTVSQNIWRGGRTSAAIEGAENDVKAGRENLAVVEQTVLFDAVSAFADVVRDQAVLQLNNNNERVLQRQLEATRDRFRVGEVTRTDVSQAESRLSRAMADRIAAEGSLTNSRAAYENIVGEKPPVLSTPTSLGDLPASLADAISDARSKNHSVLRARYNEQSARNKVREIKGALLPTVTVDGEVQANKETLNDRNENEAVSVTLNVSMPLYASGSVTSRVRAAKQVVSQRIDQYNQAIRDAVESATAAWELLQTAQAQIAAFDAAVRAAEVALEGVQEEANVGSRTVLDVLDAEQERLDASVSLVRARRDEVVASYQLRQAVGSLTASQLSLPVELYDSTKHYREVRGKWWGLEASDGR